MTGRRSVLGLIAAAGLLSSCVKKKSEETVEQAEGEITELNPLGVKKDAELEVILFSGGFGTRYATAAHIPTYKEAFPKANVKFSVEADISALAPRFAGEDQPDVVNNAGPKPLDLPALIAGKQVADLSDLLKAPAILAPDPAGKSPEPQKPGRIVAVADTLMPGAVAMFEGKPYAINYAFVVYGLWYSGKLFAERGWTAPSTWADFVALLEQMKAAGMVPYSFAGVDGAAHQVQAILTTAAKIGGPEVLRNLDDLADGAWTDDAIRQAAALWGDVGARFLDKNHIAARRSQVQALQTQGRLGFYPAGSWLETEQAKVTPPGFAYQVAALPAASPADKLPASAILAAPGDLFFVSAKGKNPRGGKEYLRQMLSAEGARKFTEMTGAPTVVTGAPEGVASASALLKGAATVSYRWPEFYPLLAAECLEATNELMFQGGSAEAFCARMQRAAGMAKRAGK